MNNAKGIIQDEVYFITTTVVNWIGIALAAPVELGTMLTAAARALLKSPFL